MAKKKTGIIAEFKQFIMRGNVIDLAIGVIIGAAFQAIVNSLVKDIITPCIGALFGNMDFSELFVVLKQGVLEDGSDTVKLMYGSFITAIINFLLMAVVIFLIIKVINTVSSKLHKEEEPEVVAPTTKMCPFCKTEIALEASRCPNCTSQLEE